MSSGHKRRWRKAALVFGAVMTIILLVGYITHLQSKGAVEKYKERLRAAGEKLQIGELIPPHIPAEKNGARLIREADRLGKYAEGFFATNPPPAMRFVAPGKAMIGWRQVNIHYRQTTNSWDEADALPTERKAEMELLRQVAENPTIDFELEYQKGFSLHLPHLATLRQCFRLLSAVTVCDLHHDNTASATTNICVMLAIIEGWRDERVPISEEVRTILAQETLAATWELLQSPATTDAQLSTLRQAWSRLEFIKASEHALLMYRAATEDTFERMRGSNHPMDALWPAIQSSPPAPSSSGASTNISEFIKSAWDDTKRGTSEMLWRMSWSHTDELRALQAQQALIDAARRIQSDGFYKDALLESGRKLDYLYADLNKGAWQKLWNGIDEDELRYQLSALAVSERRFLTKPLLGESIKQIAIAAIALKQHQLRHGRYPENMTALVPEIIPAIPSDPMDGKPVRYRLNADGTFLLYCIGEDGVDDGGDPNAKGTVDLGWQRGRDWVWSQPATAEEIQKFEEERLSKRR